MSAGNLRDIPLGIMIAAAAWMTLPLVNADDASSFNPSPIRWIGNQTYTADQMLDELNTSPEFLAATLLDDPRTDLSAVVARLVRHGHRNGGFFDPDVTCVVGDGVMECRIDEGKRYMCGDLLVRGDGEISADDLREHLTHRQPKDETFPDFIVENGQRRIVYQNESGERKKLDDPVWQSGQPVAWERLRRLNGQVAAAMASLGYRDAKIMVHLSPNHAEQTADLTIDILDEGRPAIIREIVVEGSTQQDPAAIEATIGVTVGQLCTATTIRDVTATLWQSGRFAISRVRFDSETDELRLYLNDKFGTPPIDEAISENAELILRAGQSLALRHGHERGDIVWRYEAGPRSAMVIMSPSGMLVIFESTRDADATATNSKPDRFTILMDDEHFLLDLTDLGHHWDVPIHNHQGSFALGTSLGAANDAEHFWNINLSGSVHSERADGQPIVQRTSNFRPADWLPFAYRLADKIEFDGDRLVLDNDGDGFVVDRQTGQIIQFNARGTSVRMVAGEFDRRRADALASIADKPNSFDPDRSITSFASYISDRVVREHLSPWCRDSGVSDEDLLHPVADVMEKLVKANVLSPLDMLAAKIYSGGSPDEEFYLESPRPTGLDEQGIHQTIAIVALQAAPKVFADDGWPTELVRHASLVLMGAREHPSSAIKSFVGDDDHGPLALASLAALMKTAGIPRADLMARLAQSRMDRERFRNDLRPLLESPIGLPMTQSFVALSSLSSAEKQLLIEAMPSEGWRAVLPRILHGLDSVPNATPIDLTGDAIYRISEAPFKQAMSQLMSR